ncbi:MAG: glutamate--tRNA ligase [Phycisphaerales bacterium]|nr:glutamate--tRNA ligase [Phycisphaerales bacterium]
MSTETITRFAPSPTGHLHIGGARTALLCWAYAKGKGGRFLLRIEDTDQQRSSEASTRGILEDLAWLGIDWDEGPALEFGGKTLGGDPRGVGPFFQAQRLEIYNEYIRRLIEQGKAYPAFETPEELEAKRKEAIEAKVGYKYDRAALSIPQDERIARIDAGEDHVVRLLMPDEAITVHDQILGDVTVKPEEFDDFIIRKRDGFPTYHLAVTVDDALMGVTCVVRGQEHLINTPRHIAIQRALGFPTPEYGHLPLIFNQDGSKMSKRDKDKAAKKAVRDGKMEHSPISEIGHEDFAGWLKDKTRQLPADRLKELAGVLAIELPEIEVEDFRAAGYLPSAINNYLALLGWNPKTKNADGTDLEHFDIKYLAEHFDFRGVGSGPSKFDRVKLLSFNADAIAALSDDGFAHEWHAWATRHDAALAERFSLDDMKMLAPAVKTRCKTLRDGRKVVGFALLADDAVEFDGKAVHKAIIKGEGKGLELLEAFGKELGSLEAFDPDSIEEFVNAFAERHGVGMGKVAQPVRVAVTGVAVSPPLGQTLAILGRDSVVERIARCVEFAAGQSA